MTRSALKKDCQALLASVDKHICLDAPQDPVERSNEAYPMRGSRYHYLSKEAAHALVAALASGRPLLVTGEPGIGKTRLALAAARLLERKYLKACVQPQTEYHDLLWSMDYTHRLADANQQGGTFAAQDLARYICPGPLWWALNPAEAKSGNYSRHNYQPDPEYLDDPRDAATVLLIDEVDKADVNSVALGLLEVLGENRFLVPPLGKHIPATTPAPLVVFTSNNTRELPPAFVRRCVLLELQLGDDIGDYLIEIGKQYHRGHGGDAPDEHALAVVREAAALIVKDRMSSHRLPRSGVAEYIDLLNALNALDAVPAAQRKWLDRIGHSFCKSR